MARKVEFTATDPIKINPNPLVPGAEPIPGMIYWPRDEQGNLKVLSICACGISKKFPICDGSHKGCRTEEPDHMYVYDPATGAVVSKTSTKQ